MDVHRNVIHNSQKMKTNLHQMNGYRKYACNRIFFSHKKEWSTGLRNLDLGNIMLRKLDTKGCVLNNSINMKCPEYANP